MLTLGELPTPSLVLDLDVLERNVRRMADRAGELGVALRPHFKTPKCLRVADLQRRHGARGLTVSTLAEARAVLLGDPTGEQGVEPWDDVTWAFPVILSRLDEVVEVATLREGVALRLVVDSPDAVTALETRVAPRLAERGSACHVWLKVDCGYGRCGVKVTAGEDARAVALARRVAGSELLVFDGILSHSGHAYDARGDEALARVAEEERSVMAGFAERLRGLGLAVPGVSVGSTPAMSAVRSLEGVTEARPGNYVFFDGSQVVIGSCSVSDCALTVQSQVVSHQPGAGHCVLDAGALTLSKDAGVSGTAAPDGSGAFGRMFSDYAAGALLEDCRLVSLSQEHGKADAPLPVGTRTRILPNHSCLVVPNFTEYVVARGDEVVDRWPIVR